MEILSNSVPYPKLSEQLQKDTEVEDSRGSDALGFTLWYERASGITAEPIVN